MSRNYQPRMIKSPKSPVVERNRDYVVSYSSDDEYEEVEQSFKGAFSKKKKRPSMCPHPDGQPQSVAEPPLNQPSPPPSSAPNTKFYHNLPVTLQQLRIDSQQTEQHKEMSLAQIGFASTAIPNWSGIQQPPKTDLFELLRSMIMSFEKTNVQIRIAETTFNCHMLVLQCYSEFFKSLNGEQQIVLPADQVTAQAFHKVYEWMLTCQPIVQREGILELFNAAQFLKIRGLVAQCWVCLDDDKRFSEDAAFLLYLEARVLGQDELIQRLMLNRVSKFFLTLVASREFLEFGVDELCRLLSSNSIGVNSETDVLMSAARWLDAQWSERMVHLLEVMKCVRFGLMAPWQLVELKRNVDVREIQRFVESDAVQKMVDDALSYVTTKYWYADNANTVNHYLERLQFVEPLERQWITDPLWIGQFQQSNQMCVSYGSFVKYLAVIREMGVDHWRSLQFSECNPNAVVQEQRLVSRWSGGGAEGGVDETVENIVSTVSL